MTNRELLERAAAAAGIATPLEWHSGPDWETCYARDIGPWNPLTDDGDALRLAVRLGLLFNPLMAHYLGLERLSGQGRDDCEVLHRRAIVQAAAAMFNE